MAKGGQSSGSICKCKGTGTCIHAHAHTPRARLDAYTQAPSSAFRAHVNHLDQRLHRRSLIRTVSALNRRKRNGIV